MRKTSVPKGLQSLIPVKSSLKPQKKKASVYYIETKKIRLTPEQTKKEIDKKVLKELIESIRKYGVVQPLLVTKVERRKRGGGLSVYYQLISGHKRLLAAKLVGLAVVPAAIAAGKNK